MLISRLRLKMFKEMGFTLLDSKPARILVRECRVSSVECLGLRISRQPDLAGSLTCKSRALTAGNDARPDVQVHTVDMANRVKSANLLWEYAG